MELLLALPERRAVAEPVVHARATHEAQRREAEDGAGAHLFFFVTSSFVAAVCRRTIIRNAAAPWRCVRPFDGPQASRALREQVLCGSPNCDTDARLLWHVYAEYNDNELCPQVAHSGPASHFLWPGG